MNLSTVEYLLSAAGFREPDYTRALVIVSCKTHGRSAKSNLIGGKEEISLPAFLPQKRFGFAKRSWWVHDAQLEEI